MDMCHFLFRLPFYGGWVRDISMHKFQLRISGCFSCSICLDVFLVNLFHEFHNLLGPLRIISGDLASLASIYNFELFFVKLLCLLPDSSRYLRWLIYFGILRVIHAQLISATHHLDLVFIQI